MPLTRFVCPDEIEIEIGDCLASCRLGGRCVSKPTLLLMAKQRPWTGKISTTQALNGTRLEYLKITKDYAEAPVSRAFALLGTFHHLRLQGMNVPEGLMEEKLEDDLGTGMFDFYDSDEHALWSYKTAGAYKVNRALGKKKVTVEQGTGELYKTGERKGQEKTRKVSTWSMAEPDIFEWQMQESRYANLLAGYGFPVKKIYVQVTVRDFTKQTGRQYGLDRQIYVIPVDVLSKDIVEEFYKAKQSALWHFLERNILPPPCDPRERWADENVIDFETPGRRCMEYCPVWSCCDLGIKAHAKAEEEGGEAA